MDLKDQLDRARKARDAAQTEVEWADSYVEYYQNNPKELPKWKTKLLAAGKKLKTAQISYDKLLTTYNTKQEEKKLTGEEEGVSEERLAGRKGQTVEQYRAEKQATLDKAKAERDALNQGAATQQQQATYSEFINTLAADEAQLRSVQEDLKRNFPNIYKGGITGLKDWTNTQVALETIAERRGALPKNLQGVSLREFLLKPTIDITTGTAGTGTGVPEPFGTQAIYNKSTTEGLIDSIFSSFNLGREANQAEIDQLFEELQAEQKKLSSISKGTYKMVNGRQVLVQESGLDPRTFLENRVKQLDVYKTSQAAKTEKGKQTLASTAAANGYNLDQDFAMQLPTWLESIANGEPVDKFQTAIRTAARRALPEGIRNQLDPDEDLSTTFSTYISNYARAYGVPPSSVSVSKIIPLATTDKGFATSQEFEVKKRSQKSWDGSPEAFTVTAETINDVLSNFGMVGMV